MKRTYIEPEVKVRDLFPDRNFLSSLEGPGGGDFDIDPTDPDLWG